MLEASWPCTILCFCSQSVTECFLFVSKFKMMGMLWILFLAWEGSGKVGDPSIYLSFFLVVVAPSFGITEGTVEWDYYYGANASTESEAGPVDTKVNMEKICYIILDYYMAESSSRQDEANHAFRLATQAEKNGPVLPARDFSRWSRKAEKNPFWPYGKPFIYQACSVRDGMILASGFLQRFFSFLPRLRLGP